MKRIITLLLALIVLAASFPAVYAETKSTFFEENAVSERGQEAEVLLKNLGFLWEDYSPLSGMTRKELAEVCVKLLGVEPGYVSEAYFTDTPKNYPASEYIYAAVNNGVLDFLKADEFYPEKKVSYYELLRALETILGYNLIADTSKWDVLYSYAMSNDISEGVAVKANATVKNEFAAVILKNALTAPRVTAVSFSGEPEYKLSDKDTILDFHDIIKDSGIVNATNLTSIGGVDKVGANEIRIDDEIYKVTGDFTGFIGFNVQFYAVFSDSEYTILHIEEYKNELLNIDAKDIEDTGLKSVTYEKGTSRKTVNLPGDINVIYNSNCIFDYTKEMLKPKNGSVTLIDNDSDGKWDVYVTWEYKNYIVDDIRKSTLSVTDKESGEVLLLDEDRLDFVYIEKSGKAAAFEDIKRFDVISAFESQGYVRAVISGTQADAVIDAVDAEEGIIEADGIIYNSAYGFDVSVLKPGASELLLLDFSGFVAGIKAGGFGARRAGFLINVKNDWESDTTIVKLFTEDNTWVNFTLGEKIRLNGDSIPSEELIGKTELFSDGTIGGVAVLYKINAEGVLKEIETAKGVPEEADELRHTADKKKRRFSEYTNSFMPDSKYMDFFVDDETVVFRVPAAVKDKYDGEKYQVSSMSWFSGNEYYTVQAFGATDTVPADIVVCYTDNDASSIGSGSSMSVVNKTYTGINAQGDVVKFLECYTDGVINLIWSDNLNRFDGLKKGSVIRYSVDMSGNVTYVDKLFNPDSPPLLKQGTANASGAVAITNEFCTVYGRVVKKNSGYITVGLDDNPADYPKESIYPVGGAKIYCFDRSDNMISVIEADDIELYDMIFMRTNKSVPKDVLVIKN